MSDRARGRGETRRQSAGGQSASASRVKLKLSATTKMNRTEADWAKQLEILKRAGEILDFRFEGLKFKLAPSTFYTPDFFVVNGDGSGELHEVKGFWRDDARVKFKVAAALYPWFGWKAIQRGKKQAWEIEVIR